MRDLRRISLGVYPAERVEITIAAPLRPGDFAQDVLREILRDSVAPLPRRVSGIKVAITYRRGSEMIASWSSWLKL